jgi:SAM-dependent methyltransferase
VRARVFEVLACPHCRQALKPNTETIECESCRASFLLQVGIPVFLPEPVEVVPPQHESNALGAEFEAILDQGEALVLNIGAGATARRTPNCVEFEHKIFRNTDVVGDAHFLPFRDNIFDHVFAFNVFEHLRQPAVAAAEILRVLKPGGRVAVHTAFLQPLHEAPDHYYNATEFGVREWFRNFEIEKCEVSGNFSPGYALGFLAATLLDTLQQSDLSVAKQMEIADTRLGQWADFWRQKSAVPPGFSELLALPQEFQTRLAAGFELLAQKKPGTR